MINSEKEEKGKLKKNRKKKKNQCPRVRGIEKSLDARMGMEGEDSKGPLYQNE